MPRPTTPFWNNNAAPALHPGLNDRETAILDYVKEAAARHSGGKVVCSAYAPQRDKDAADYVCDGTADETEINAAIDAVKAETPAQHVPGGGVRLHGPRFRISSPIIMKPYITLEGTNWFHSEIRAVSGFTGDQMIQLSSVNDEYTVVRDLRIHGAYLTGFSGIGYDNTGGSFTFSDATHSLENLYIHGIPNAGVWFKGENRGSFLRQVRVIDAGTYGFHIDAPDCHIVQCDSGSAGSHGFNITGSNHRISACKSWFSGNGNGTVGNGFHVPNPRNELVGCEAQDNACHGFYLASPEITLAGCLADSNSWYSANPTQNHNSFDGFHIATTSGRLNLQIIAKDKNEGARGHRQRYGINFASVPKDSIVDIVGDGNVSGLVGGTTTGASAVGLFIRGSGLRSDGTTRDTILVHNGNNATIP